MRWPRTTVDLTCDAPGCAAELTDVDMDDDLAPAGWVVRAATEDDPDHYLGAEIHLCPRHVGG